MFDVVYDYIYKHDNQTDSVACNEWDIVCHNAIYHPTQVTY